MKISIIVAMDEKRGIGKENRIPWRLRDDLIRLKTLTLDHVVILGRTTYDSMVGYYNKSGRPMPGKLYVVVTRDTSYKPERDNAAVAHSIEEALQKAKEIEDDEVFVIGGQKIFEQTLPFVDTLYLTVVAGDYSADTFFPDYSSFTKVREEQNGSGEGYNYTFKILERASPTVALS